MKEEKEEGDTSAKGAGIRLNVGKERANGSHHRVTFDVSSGGKKFNREEEGDDMRSEGGGSSSFNSKKKKAGAKIDDLPGEEKGGGVF